jgi:hypothetical protein
MHVIQEYIENPWLEINKLLDNYSPKSESKIISLLLIIMMNLRESPDMLRWHFSEKLSTLLKKRIEMHIKESWRLINKGIGSQETGKILDNILNLISRSEIQMNNYGMGSNFEKQRRQIFHFRSLINNPLSEKEVEFVVGHDSFKLTRIDTSVDSGPDIIDITPLPELDDDNLSGHQLRAAGYCDWCIEVGQVVIGNWCLPVIETSENQFGIPIQKILALTNIGCPHGYVLGGKKSFCGRGFDQVNQECNCPLMCCRGQELLSAGRLPVLASKISQIFHDSSNLRLLGFDENLITSKTT